MAQEMSVTVTRSESGSVNLPARGVLERAEVFGRRIPFTLSTVAMIALAGWLTNTANGVQLGARAIARVGFAPSDTTSFDLVRAVMSAFVTNGPFAFWLAIGSTAALAGFVEWRAGSVRASIAFWGSHLIVIALSWILLAPLHLTGDATARLLYVARDVGPSAGYVGCLGYLLFGLGGRVRWLVLASGFVILAGMLAFALRGVATEPAEVSAALSHFLALLVGFALGALTRPKQAAPAQGA